MVGDILQPTHLLLVLVVALLVLGPKRLPEVARHLGSGIRDFREAISGDAHDRTSDTSHQVTPVTTPPEAVQTDAVVSEPEPFVAPPAPPVSAEPETMQADAVVAEPTAHDAGPGPTAPLAEPVVDDGVPEPTAPLAAPEHPPAPAPDPAAVTDATAVTDASESPDSADAATTELSSQHPA